MDQCQSTRQRRHISRLKKTERHHHLAPVVSRLDNTIHWLNRYPEDNQTALSTGYISERARRKEQIKK